MTNDARIKIQALARAQTSASSCVGQSSSDSLESKPVPESANAWRFKHSTFV